jgi:hypothetical protein
MIIILTPFSSRNLSCSALPFWHATITGVLSSSPGWSIIVVENFECWLIILWKNRISVDSQQRYKIERPSESTVSIRGVCLKIEKCKSIFKNNEWAAKVLTEPEGNGPKTWQGWTSRKRWLKGCRPQLLAQTAFFRANLHAEFIIVTGYCTFKCAHWPLYSDILFCSKFIYLANTLWKFHWGKLSQLQTLNLSLLGHEWHVQGLYLTVNAVPDSECYFLYLNEGINPHLAYMAYLQSLTYIFY